MRVLEKAGFPYSVDMSINSHNTFDSEFSTPNKRTLNVYYTKYTKNKEWAEFYNIKYLLNKLFEGNVFEVNFGGGEPTEYRGKNSDEDFPSILFYAKQKGFRVSFVTKNYDLPSHPRIHHILKNTDHISIVCDTPEDIDRAAELQDFIATNALNEPDEETSVAFQASMFTWNTEKAMKWLRQFEKRAVNSTGLNLTHTSLHSDLVSEQWVEWVKDIHERLGNPIAFDWMIITSFAQQFKQYGLSNYHLVGTEGNETCFIDAVNNVIKPYSYGEKEFEFDVRGFDIKEEFKRF